MTKFYTDSFEETMKLGERFAQKIEQGCTILFFGDLGAGKTTFIKGMAQGLGIESDAISSPSFQYLKIHQGRLNLYHFDLWRLENCEQFFAQGFDEFLQDPQGVSCLEWAEKINLIQLGPTIKISLQHERENRRIIEIQDEKAPTS